MDDVTATPVVLSLGSNLGDRLGQLRRAVDLLVAGSPLTLRAVSGVYETDPVGGPEQPDYYNIVLLADAATTPLDLLRHCQSVERALDRVRVQRWGPRTIDVDIICFGDLRSDDPVLTLPHPRAHERAFVLVPWLAVDPAAHLPGHGPVADLLAGLDPTAVRATALTIQ